MAFLEFKNVRIAGMSAGVPRNIVSNLHPTDSAGTMGELCPEAFVEMTGVRERRVSYELTTSDLCYAAAERLMADLGWERNEIEALVFVSQTADYLLPATACILQDRLGLSKDCYAEDVALGCSGWVYGLSNVASLLATGNVKKALLLCGDSKCNRNQFFGHAGTATAVEYAGEAEGMKFHFGTDGSGFDAIITPDGGSRNQVSLRSFELEDVDGIQMHRLQTRTKSIDFFTFGIITAPKSIKKLAEHFGINYQDADYLVLHQANTKMNNKIAQKLKMQAEKVPSSMYYFGNTSSASIPLTIVTQLKDKCKGKTKFICCGFGVGLSWGTVAFETNDIVISDLVEVNDDAKDKKHVV